MSVPSNHLLTVGVLTYVHLPGLYPNRMYINRGNHETREMNRTYGFEGEAKHKHGEQTYKLFAHVFTASKGSPFTIYCPTTGADIVSLQCLWQHWYRQQRSLQGFGQAVSSHLKARSDTLSCMAVSSAKTVLPSMRFEKLSVLEGSQGRRG